MIFVWHRILAEIPEFWFLNVLLYQYHFATFQRMKENFLVCLLLWLIWHNQHLLSFTNVVSSKRKVINHIKFQFRLIFFSLTFPLIINTNGNLHDIKFNACHKLNILNLQYIEQIAIGIETMPADDPESQICWLCVMDVNREFETQNKNDNKNMFISFQLKRNAFCFDLRRNTREKNQSTPLTSL